MLNREVILGLEEIARLVKKNTEDAKVAGTISGVRNRLGGLKDKPSFKQLDEELTVWETKLNVILKEPAGRQGMAKHALYWAEQLKNVT